MRAFVKTIGWLLLSGLIIFSSNLIGGVHWWTALKAAFIAKIGTTIAYYFYEVIVERCCPREQTPAAVATA